MAKTLRDSISQVRTMFKLTSFDDSISDRAIGHILKNTAIKFIKQQVERRKLFASPNLFTPLDCISMIQVPLSECVDYTSSVMISRSKYQIPKISESIYGLLVQGVWGLEKKVKYTETTANRYANTLRLNLKKEGKYFWVVNNYLYVSDSAVDVLSMAAYFEEEFDESQYSCEDVKKDCPNNPLDSEFKCPSFLLADVEKETYNIILQTYKRSVGDDTSNQRDESK